MYLTGEHILRLPSKIVGMSNLVSDGGVMDSNVERR